ncbi:MAG: hypothetical protein HN348_12760, partial [Proteobacteria bacterium]|nr:hypothetical protein [Pseudomonadota bacterium]
THSFVAKVGAALNNGFSSSSNEAIADGLVELDDYDGVLWLLGDEGLADQTFDQTEENLLESYVGGGGSLIVSGAEVGYATDSTWLSNVLHAGYVADNGGTNVAGGYTFGAEYEEDYPDVLSGETVIWKYNTGGSAAVGWAGQIIVVGFGLENLEAKDRAEAYLELTSWVDDS